MDIEFKGKAYAFRPWRPACGRVIDRTFAFDTETTLIDEVRSWLTPSYVLGAAFDGRRGWFITRDQIAAFFEAHRGIPFIAHNVAFDLKVVRAAAPSLDIYEWVEENCVWDTMLLFQLLSLGTRGTVTGKKGSASLDRLTRRFLDVSLPKLSKDSAGSPVRLSYGKWLNRPPSEIEPPYLTYLGLDVIATFKLYKILRRRIARMLRNSEGTWGFVSPRWLREQFRRWGPQTHHIHLRASVALDAIHALGIRIDPDRTATLEARLTHEIAELKVALAGHGYLAEQKGSMKALQAILQRVERDRPELDFPRTPKGLYSTRKEVLEELALHVPIADLLLKHRAAATLKATFVTKLNSPTVRARYRTLTRTGRTSSFGQINAQNLPRAAGVRECFVPRPGYVFLSADYATIELATLAQACATQFNWDSAMALAINAGQDLHRLVAARVLGKAESEVTKTERAKSKAINFGKPGGMGDRALRAYAKSTYGVDLTDQETEALSEGWFDAFPEMRLFLAEESKETWTRLASALDLTPEDHAVQTGDHRFLRHPDNVRNRCAPSSILGAMCLKAIGDAKPATRDGRAYSDADVDYFWTKVEAIKDQLPVHVQPAIAARRAGFPVKKAVRALCDRAGVFTLTGRLRANTGYCQRHNTVFQGLASDGAKLALWNLWRAGFRVVNFIHDEFLIEIPADSDLTSAAEKVRTHMVAAMKQVVPDIDIRVEYAAMSRWSKDAEPVRDGTGKLRVWEPVKSDTSRESKPVAKRTAGVFPEVLA